MRDDYTLLTPENVELRYDVAGLGSRLIAATVDYALLSVGYLALIFGAYFASAGIDGLADWLSELDGRGYSALADTIGVSVLALAVLLTFFGWWGYFVLFELLWNGQSPGKRLLGLRVVRSGGQPITITASLVRNVLRAVDVALFVGVVAMLFDRLSRRLGDLAAGTLVIREPRALARAAFAPITLPDVPAMDVSVLPNAGRLTMAHYTLLRDYFARRAQLPRRRAEALAAHLAVDLGRVLEIAPSHVGDPVTFLATAARAFETHHRYYDAPQP